MNMSPIQRLKKTWGKINKDKFEILEVCIGVVWEFPIKHHWFLIFLSHILYSFDQALKLHKMCASQNFFLKLEITNAAGISPWNTNITIMTCIFIVRWLGKKFRPNQVEFGQVCKCLTIYTEVSVFRRYLLMLCSVFTAPDESFQ